MTKLILPLFVFVFLSQPSFSQISWQQVGTGIQPGIINTAYVFNNSTHKILLGTDSQGLLFSSDGGATWNALNNGLPAGASITSIDILSNGRLVVAANGGIYASDNNILLSSNLAWTELNSSTTYISNANLVFVDDNGTIWAFTKTAAFRTTVGGTGWIDAGLSGLSGINGVARNGNGFPSISWINGTADCQSNTSWLVSNLSSFILQDNNYQTVNSYKFDMLGNRYYASSNGVHKFSSSFSNLSYNLPTVPYTASVTAPIKVNDITYLNGDLYIATQDVSTSLKEGNIYKLSQGTTQWIKLGNGLPQNVFKYSKIFSVSNNPAGASLYALGSEGLFKSTDAGATWTSVTQNAPIKAGIKSFTFLNDGSIAAATQTGKIYLGNPAATIWQDISSPIISGSIGHIKADGNNTLYVTAGFAPPGMSSASAGLFYSKDLGKTWTKAFPADRGSSMDINITTNNEVLVGGNFDPSPDGEAIHFSSDGGSTWSTIVVNNGSAGSIFSANKMSNGNLLAGSETGGVLRSTDNGSTFVSIGNTTGKAGNVIRVDLAPWGDVFISFDYTRGMYLVTSTSSTSPSPAAAQLGNYPALTNSLDVVFGNTNNVYLATDKGFYSSSDNGVTFVSGNSGIKQQKILRLAINKFDGHLYLANSEGLFKSTVAVVTPIATKFDQTITFNSLASKKYGDAAFTLSATSTSGLPISYTSSNQNVVRINGDIATIVGAGSANITASQSGSSNYNRTPDVTQTQVIDKADQVISFSLLSSAKVGDAPFQIVSTSTSGLPITYTSSNTNVAAISGDILTIVGPGTTNITASQNGNTNYKPASSLTRTLSVSPATKLDQTIVFNQLANRKFGDLPFALDGTASSALAVSYASSNANVATITGNIVTIRGAGSTNITASQFGDARYNPAAVVQRTLTVDKAIQTLFFEAARSKIMGEQPFSLQGTASSGLPVLFSSSNVNVATVSGNTVTLIGPGTTDLVASQLGNSDFEAAENISIPLTVNLITDVETHGTLTLFPNPVKTSAIMKFTDSYDGSSCEVYNMHGIKMNVPTQQISNDQVILDFDNVSEGMYILQVRKKGKQVWKAKILKSK